MKKLKLNLKVTLTFDETELDEGRLPIDIDAIAEYVREAIERWGKGGDPAEFTYDGIESADVVPSTKPFRG